MVKVLPPLLKKRASLEKLLEGEKVAHEQSFIASIFNHSPYLTGIIRRNPEFLEEIFETKPSAFIEKMRLDLLSFESKDEEAMSAHLRLFKRKSSLFLALMDLNGTLPCMEVTRILTEMADISVQKALDFALSKALDEGHISAKSSGLFVIAMGKMGAFELNYSSDIDLILFFDPEKLTVRADLEAGMVLEKICKRLVSLLDARTSEGYVYRVDVRLRPDPSSTPIVISTRQALHYYESMGQTWERSAFIKARICAGDLEAGNAFLAELTPFIWRKYMDFTAISEIHEMKEQINAFKGHGEIKVLGHNLKLGRGGIREIEFYAQAQQLLGGGRNPPLRHHQTLQAFENLVAAGWVSGETANELKAAYVFLRQLEHRLQMLHDEQTHTLPSDALELDNFARFCGFETLKLFEKALLHHLKTVEKAYIALFSEKKNEIKPLPLDFSTLKPKPQTLSTLISLGFKDPPTAYETMKAWKGSLKSKRLKDELFAFLTPLLTQFSKAGEPDQAILAFDKLITKAKHPLDLLSLLRQDVSHFALILAVSPRLAKQITRRAHVLDGLFEPAFKGEMPTKQALKQALMASLALAPSKEDFLDRLRIFGQEQHFLTSLRVLTSALALEKAGEAFTIIADLAIETAFYEAQKEMEALHGALPTARISIIAMGKCGAEEMNASSDLDLMVIYDFDEKVQTSSGEKPLTPNHYCSKLTQKFIGILTVETSEGGLFEVDMRLRPSGNKGTVATSLTSFQEYHAKEALIWEAMALTKARVIVATNGLEKDVKRTIQGILNKKRDKAFVREEIAEMREMIADEKGNDEAWDFKNAKGGLIDIEFIAQGLQLIHSSLPNGATKHVLEAAVKQGFLPDDTLIKALMLQQNLLHLTRIALDEKTESFSTSLKKLLSRANNEPSFSHLQAKLKEAQEKARVLFTEQYYQ